MPVNQKSLGTKDARVRDSLFLLADITFEGSADQHKVKVRNLSPGGMMVEADLEAQQGQRLVTVLRNIGPVRGQIAWVRHGQFGVAFDWEVDHRLARQPVGGGTTTPRYLRTSLNIRSSMPR